MILLGAQNRPLGSGVAPNLVEVFAFEIIIPEMTSQLFRIMNVFAYFLILNLVYGIAVVMLFVFALPAVLMHMLKAIFIAAKLGS